MRCIRNENGTVIVFITLMMVVLLIMIGMGLDTGQLAFVRSQGQPAVDAAALAAASAIPIGSETEVENRVKAFKTQNNYLNSTNNQITKTNITYVSYDSNSQAITTGGITIANANGVRVALESKNPHTGGTPGTTMTSPLFLTPLLKVFGQSAPNSANINVSAVAVIQASPDLPIATQVGNCGPAPQKPGDVWQEQKKVKLVQSSAKADNSGYTTYHIHNASKTEINNLLQAGLKCSGGVPSIGVGFCTELNNGQITSLYDEFESVFKADQGRCYLIPVVKDGVAFNQCEPIQDFAKFCPIACESCSKGNTFGIDKDGSNRYIYGNLTCGQNINTTRDARCQMPRLVRDKLSGM